MKVNNVTIISFLKTVFTIIFVLSLVSFTKPTYSAIEKMTDTLEIKLANPKGLKGSKS